MHSRVAYHTDHIPKHIHRVAQVHIDNHTAIATISVRLHYASDARLCHCWWAIITWIDGISSSCYISIYTVVEYQFSLIINNSYLAICIEVIPCCREIHRLHQIEGEEKQAFVTVLADEHSI